jgi:hypothetical protein
MSVRGSGTRPALDCIKAEGIATKLGLKGYRRDIDGRDRDMGLINGFWRSNADMVLPV